MTVRSSIEFDIPVPPSVVMEVLLDVESLPEWSGPHKSAVIIDEHEDGSPKTVKVSVSTAGISDDQTLTYTWTENSCTWDLVESNQLAKQHGTYTVTPKGDGSHVEFVLDIDLKIKLPGMLVKRGQKVAVETAKKGLTDEAKRRV